LTRTFFAAAPVLAAGVASFAFEDRASALFFCTAASTAMGK